MTKRKSQSRIRERGLCVRAAATAWTLARTGGDCGGGLERKVRQTRLAGGDRKGPRADRCKTDAGGSLKVDRRWTEGGSKVDRRRALTTKGLTDTVLPLQINWIKSWIKWIKGWIK